MYALCSSPICFSLLFSIDSIAIEFNFLFFIHLQFCTLSSSVLFLSTSLIYLVRCLLFLFSEKEISSHGLHISHESLSLPLSYAMFPFLLDLLILLNRKLCAERKKKQTVFAECSVCSVALFISIQPLLSFTSIFRRRKKLLPVFVLKRVHMTD